MSSKIISEFRPLFYQRKDPSENEKLDQLIAEAPSINVLDHFEGQIKELFKVRNPTKRLSDVDLDALYAVWQETHDPSHEGVWVYYPWSNRLIHLLAKDEFIELRTSRNKHKITTSEQQTLLNKRLGIIGLSVGHAVALTLAAERACGSLKLADFDTLELSNLNRIRTGVHNIGINKCIVTAREIAEIDPYIDIECFTEGITPENFDKFVLGGGKLDILIDECDDIGIKILCRQKARKMGLPVVMETSDRGMLDVERFDLEPERAIFHGMLADIPEQMLQQIGPEQRLPLVMKIVDAFNSSVRGQASLLELGQTITTWPQLASAVTLGGGVVTDVCRRILLGQFNSSGRYHVDLEGIISDPKEQNPEIEQRPFDPDTAFSLIDQLNFDPSTVQLSDTEVEKIISEGVQVYSEYNSQPWQWVYRNGHLHLFTDTRHIDMVGNPNQISSNTSLASSLEKTRQHITGLGLETSIEIAEPSSYPLFASILISVRNPGNQDEQKVHLDNSATHGSASAEETVRRHAPLAPALFIASDQHERDELVNFLSRAQLMMLLHDNAHREYFSTYMRWSPADHGSHGTEFSLLNLNPVQRTAFIMLRNPRVASAMSKIDGNNLLLKTFEADLAASALLGYMVIPADKTKAGEILQKISNDLVSKGMVIDPVIAPTALYSRRSGGEILSENERSQLREFENMLYKFLSPDIRPEQLLFFKVVAENSSIRTMQRRRPLNEILYISHERI